MKIHLLEYFINKNAIYASLSPYTGPSFLNIFEMVLLQLVKRSSKMFSIITIFFKSYASYGQK